VAICNCVVLQPLGVFLLEDGREAQNFGAFISLVYFNLNGVFYVRNSSYFEEPGTYALVLIHFIVVGFLFRKKWSQVLLFVSGVTTFSLAFFATTIMYLVGIARRWNYLVIIVIASILLSLGTSVSESGAAAVAKNLVYERLFGEEDGNDGFFRGDNRSREILLAYSVFVEAPLFGVGFTNAKENYEEFGSNFLAPFAYFGVIGACVFYLHVVIFLFVLAGYLTRLYKPIITISIILILVVTYAQRPQVYGYLVQVVIMLLTHYLTGRRIERGK
jgi:hypothetical protein